MCLVHNCRPGSVEIFKFSGENERVAFDFSSWIVLWLQRVMHIAFSFSCGYVLKPDLMFRDNYNPYDKKMLVNIDPMAVSLTVGIYFFALQTLTFNILVSLLTDLLENHILHSLVTKIIIKGSLCRSLVPAI